MLRLAHLLIAATALTLAAPALAAPAMWKVSDEDSRVWLFGSIHLMPDGQDWRTPTFDQVLAKADRVYFETNMSPEQQAVIAAEAFVRGIYTDGTLLTDVLDDAQEALLRSAAAEHGIALGPILAMRPWMAAQAVTGPILMQSGFLGEGVELQVLGEIASDRLGYFETGLQQLDVLTTGPEEEEIAMLVQALEGLPTMTDTMFDMLALWMGGDDEQLDELMLNETAGIDGFAERLLFDRNMNWLAPIKAMLAENEANLIIVGAAHLGGVQGVPALLEQAGYTVERVQ